MLVEACVDSVEGAVAAERGGAARVELCQALLEGGLTPSAGAIAVARRLVRIGLHVLVRPRGGDFLYSETEMAAMERDIELAGELGADGVVLGVLDAEGRVDAVRTARLVERARPMSVTFHRAFDMTRDPFEALEAVVALGADRILSSGQEATALEGCALLRELVERAGDRIVVMPGGGIDERNAGRIARETKARELHVTGFVSSDGPMRFRNERVFMGGVLRPPEYRRTETDAERIRAIVGRAEEETKR